MQINFQVTIISQFILERDVLEVFDRVTNLYIIKCNLDYLNNDFKYLLQTFSLPVHDVGWGKTNNLLANIDRE